MASPVKKVIKVEADAVFREIHKGEKSKQYHSRQDTLQCTLLRAEYKSVFFIDCFGFIAGQII